MRLSFKNLQKQEECPFSPARCQLGFITILLHDFLAKNTDQQKTGLFGDLYRLVNVMLHSCPFCDVQPFILHCNWSAHLVESEIGPGHQKAQKIHHRVHLMQIALKR
jgi:hypothetical protein